MMRKEFLQFLTFSEIAKVSSLNKKFKLMVDPNTNEVRTSRSLDNLRQVKNIVAALLFRPNDSSLYDDEYKELMGELRVST